MKVFYFGAWGGTGHHIWTPSAQTARTAGPWTSGELDAQPLDPIMARYADADLVDPARGFMPISTCEQQPLGVWRLRRGREATGQSWTALGCWDRSCDRRLNSKSVFVAEGEHDEAAMRTISEQHFPQVWARIMGTGK